MLYVVLGKPGVGKSFYLAHVARRQLKRKRRVYANFPIRGTRPWPLFTDVAVFRDCCFIGDEIGTQYNSRRTMEFSQIEFAALTMHRKGSNDLYVAAQHAGFVDIQFRRITTAFIFLKRFGFDGRAALLGKPPRFWRRPWCFRAEWFYGEDLDENLELKPGATAFFSEWIPWSRKVADSYDTTNVYVPKELEQEFAVIEQSMASRYELPVVGVDRPSVADLGSVVVPVPGKGSRPARPVAPGEYLHKRFYGGALAKGRVRKLRERPVLASGAPAPALALVERVES